tara:strand:+ start:466 stop:1116 length:651 start_codon:yes stop_codon:yes gene_type:complete
MLNILISALLLFPNPNIFLSRRNIITSSIGMTFLNSKSNNNNEDDGNGIIRGYKNNLYYSGPITDSSIFTISTNLINMQNEGQNDNINLHIQSWGGSLLPTFGLVDLIRISDIPINTYVDSYCASAASLITVVGANRFINKHGVVLIHQLKMGLDPSKYLEIKDQTDNADTLMELVKNIYLENTNLTREKLDYLLMHDWWLNSTLCKEYGIIDIIL